MSSLDRTVVPFFWTSTPALSFVSGQALDQSLNQSVTNPQNYPLAYTLIGGALPSGCTLSSNGTVAYNGTGAVTSTSVQFRVASGGFNAESSVGSIQIQVGAQAPVFTLAPATASLPSTGGTIQFTASAATAVTYSLVSTRNGITINSSTGLVTVSSAAQATSGFISVRATASGLSTDVNCSVTVAAYVTAGWQKVIGNYVPAKMGVVIIHPRPDTETLSYERHRMAPSGVAWSIPLQTQGGAWPELWEAITVPAGMVVTLHYWSDGQPRYWSLDWDNPTIGTHSISLSVKTQEYDRNSSGLTDYATVSFTLNVYDKTDSSRFLFVDASAASSGSGTYAAPFKTIDDWYGATTTDATHQQKQVFYRAGTYACYSTVNGGNVALSTVKPRVHIAYPSESVILDQTNGNINFTNAHGAHFSGFRLNNSDTTAANWRSFAVNAVAHRLTWFENYWYNQQIGSVGTDNNDCVYGPNSGGPRQYICLVGNTYDTLGSSSNGMGCGQFYNSEYIAHQGNELKNIGDGLYNGFWMKTSARRITFRSNRATEGITGSALAWGMAASAMVPEYVEFCWNYFRNTSPATDDITYAPYDVQWDATSFWDYRNTYVGVVFSKTKDKNGLRLTYLDDVVATDASPKVRVAVGSMESVYTDTSALVGSSSINADGTLTDEYLSANTIARGSKGHEAY